MCKYLCIAGEHNVTCFKCKNIIQRVHNLLAEIECIKGKQTIGVCDYCKQKSIYNCKRCEYIVSKFMTSNAYSIEVMSQYLISWVRRVMISLQLYFDGCISKHILNVRDNCVEELQRLLYDLESPLTIRQPDYLNIMKNKIITSLQSIVDVLLENNKLNEREASVEELQRIFKELQSYPSTRQPNTERFKIIKEIQSLDKLKVMELLMTLMPKFYVDRDLSCSRDSGNFYTKPIYSTQIIKKSSCDNISFEKKRSSDLCAPGKHEYDKNENDKNTPKGNIKIETGTKISSPKIKIKPNKKIKDDAKGKKIIEHQTKNEYAKKNTIIEHQTKKDDDQTKRDDAKETKDKKVKRIDKETNKKVKKEKELTRDDSEELMMKNFTAIKSIIKPKENMVKPFLDIKIQSMLELPDHRCSELNEDSISSVVECNDTRVFPNVMIKNKRISPLDQGLNSISNQDVKVPLLYRVHKSISSSSLPLIVTASLPTVTHAEEDKSEELSDKGVIKYQLSNPEFISKGWTQLPSLRLQRCVNIYRMKPVNSSNNWFKRNINSTVFYMGSDDKLADVDELGYGRLYYKNGKVALDYYKAKEPGINYRYIVYSDGEPKNGVPTPVTILGIFDGIGCGVVYDTKGRERLKYNQFEGKVIDKSIDTPSRWLWHTLNEPPDLQTVFFENFSKDTSIHNRNKTEIESTCSKNKNKNADMLEIELSNFTREKAAKLLKKFKPLEIKTKTLKMNRQFSLRICHQTLISLVFREARTSIKLNLGLRLISNEIVDTECYDVGSLFTTVDQFLPRSESVKNIHQMLSSARKLKEEKITSPSSFYYFRNSDSFN